MSPKLSSEIDKVSAEPSVRLPPIADIHSSDTIGLMITERELWACANEVLKQHGDKAPAFVASRIGTLALAGDNEGVQTWKRIGSKMDQLLSNAASTH